ncbi:hypothetical protein BKA62DRAFT_776100 [Auriculariales sp. MPI-PUGE-AT-0066]|nr:hypothetical protein BKA62DRAFT_776100 [Auriculariales sp. MPI-PUGE-AT-0066]
MTREVYEAAPVIQTDSVDLQDDAEPCSDRADPVEVLAGNPEIDAEDAMEDNWQRSSGEEEHGSSTAVHQLVQHDLAARMGLCLNRYHRLIICTTCNWAVPPVQVEKHVRRHLRAIRLPVGAEEQLKNACAADDKPQLPRDGAPPVDPLHVIPANWCRACGAVLTKFNHVKDHRCPGMTIEPIAIQRPLKGGRVFFRCGSVSPEAPKTPSVQDELRAAKLRHIKALIGNRAPMIPDETYQINEAARRSYGLSGFALGKTNAELVKLSQLMIINPRDLATADGRLRYAIEFYVNEVHLSLNDSATRTIRCTLRSDKKGETSQVPLDAIQTVGKYASVLVKFLSCVVALRNQHKDDLPFELRSETRDAACNLFNAVNTSGRFDQGGHAVQSAVHRLSWLLFDHRCHRIDEINRTPLVVATYLFCLLPNTADWIPVAHSSFYTAALSWLGRMTAYQEIMQRASISPDESLETIADNVYSAVKDGHFTAFNQLRGNHRIAMSESKRLQGTAHLQWDVEVPGLFLYDGRIITTQRLSDMFNAMVTDLQDLVTVLFLDEDADDPIYQFPSQVVDKWGSSQTGYSFVVEQENEINSFLLLDRVYESLMTFPPGAAAAVYTLDICKKWHDTYLKFLHLLAAVMYALGGLPPHASEIRLTTYTRDGGRDRTIRVGLHNQIFDVGTYHKTVSITGGQDASIVRGFDTVVSRLIMLDMAYLRPVGLFLATEVFGLEDQAVRDMQHYAFFAFGVDFPASMITRVLTRYSLAYFGLSIGVRDWRQMADSIFDRKLRGSLDLAASIRDDMTLSGGHRPTVRGQWYGLEWGKLRAVDQDLFAQFIREWLRLWSRPVPGGDTQKPTTTSAEPLALTETDVARISRAVIDALIPEVEQRLPHLLSRQVESSVRAVVGAFRLELIRNRGEPLASRSIGLGTEITKDMPFRNGVRLIDGLRHFFGLGAEFRSPQQMLACFLAAQRSVDVAFIAPCDAGKSLAYQLPIFCADGAGIGQYSGTTVIIVPYISLADDVVRSLNVRGIPSTRWTVDNQRFESATIVVADTAMRGEFRSQVLAEAQSGSLKRIVLDEYHVYEYDRRFRPILANINWIQTAAVPILYLGDSSASKRANLRLVAKCVPEEQQPIHALQFANLLRDTPSNVTIVFAFTIARVRQLAKDMGGCLVYHGDMIDQDRSKVIQQ